MDQEPQIWIGMVEVVPLPGCDLLSPGAAGAFTNVLTWATTDANFREVVEPAMRSYGFAIIDISEVESLSSRTARFEVDEQIHVIADQMLAQPNAVRYSTFYTYPSD